MEVSKSEDIALVVFVGTSAFALVIIALFLFIRLYQTRMRDKENQLLQLESESRLRLLKSVLEAEEKQKEIISRNLHDEIGAALTVLKMNINNYSEDLPTEKEEELLSINEGIDNVINDIRAVCRDLIPRELSLFGINTALSQFCATTAENAKLNIELTSNYNGFLDNPTNELIYFRLFKEVLNNIIKHSKASKILCTISQSSNELQTSFQYNGTGISNEEIEQIKKTNTSIGLSSIESRLMALNGTINYKKQNQSEENLVNIVLHKNGI